MSFFWYFIYYVLDHAYKKIFVDNSFCLDKISISIRAYIFKDPRLVGYSRKNHVYLAAPSSYYMFCNTRCITCSQPPGTYSVEHQLLYCIVAHVLLNSTLFISVQLNSIKLWTSIFNWHSVLLRAVSFVNNLIF